MAATCGPDIEITLTLTAAGVGERDRAPEETANKTHVRVLVDGGRHGGRNAVGLNEYLVICGTAPAGA
jgi:hypothetical protein